MEKLIFCTGTGDINQWCGVSKSTLLIAQGLNGYDVSFVTTGGYGITNELRKRGIFVKVFNFTTGIFRYFSKGNIFYKIRAIFRILIYWLIVLRYFYRQKPAIIYCATLSSAFLYILPAKILKVKVAMAIRGAPSKALHWKWIYRLSDVILPLSEDLKKLVYDHPRLLKKNTVLNKITVIPNGVGIPSNPSRSIKDTITILYLGVFDIRKGQLDFIENICPRIEGNCKVVFAGAAKRKEDENYYLACISAARKLHRNKKDLQFDFLGFVTDVDSVLREADVLVLASKSEGQPRAIIEAMSYALPVVSYDVTSVDDLLVKNSAGFVVDNGDAKAFASCLNMLINDSSMRLAMGGRGRDYIVNNLTELQVCKKHELIFKELIDEN